MAVIDDNYPTTGAIALAIYDLASAKSGKKTPDREDIKATAELVDIMERGIYLILLPKIIEKAVEEKKREWLQFGNYLIHGAFYRSAEKGWQ